MKPADSKMKVEYGTDVTSVSFNDIQILDEHQIHRIQDELIAVVDKSAGKKLILNFADVQFMSSAFLGLLVRVHKRLCEAKGQLQLINLSANIQKIFEITRLTDIFDIS